MERTRRCQDEVGSLNQTGFESCCFGGVEREPRVVVHAVVDERPARLFPEASGDGPPERKLDDLDGVTNLDVAGQVHEPAQDGVCGRPVRSRSIEVQIRPAQGHLPDPRREHLDVCGRAGAAKPRSDPEDAPPAPPQAAQELLRPLVSVVPVDDGKAEDVGPSLVPLRGLGLGPCRPRQRLRRAGERCGNLPETPFDLVTQRPSEPAQRPRGGPCRTERRGPNTRQLRFRPLASLRRESQLLQLVLHRSKVGSLGRQLLLEQAQTALQARLVVDQAPPLRDGSGRNGS